MKRVSADDLERLAHANPGTDIVRDPNTNVATLQVGREVFYAQYEAEVQS